MGRLCDEEGEGVNKVLRERRSDPGNQLRIEFISVCIIPLDANGFEAYITNLQHDRNEVGLETQ